MNSDKSEFKYEIILKPDYSYLTVQVPGGQTLKVEASSMATMDVNMQMKTKFKGGIGRLLTGESIFINEFTAEGGNAEICIAPSTFGDMEHLYLDNENVYLQNSGFLASSLTINVETKWQGFMKGFFSGEGLFLIRCSGHGDLWFNSFGGIMPIDIDGEYIVDTGHIVAFTEGLDYQITSVGGYKSLFFSGEGFVCHFSGKGRVWIQTRNPSAFCRWTLPFRPTKRKK